MFPTKIFLVSLILLSLFLLKGCSLIGGAFTSEPEQLFEKISPGAKALMEKAFEDIPETARRDYHTHILGMNTELNGTFVNEDWQTPFGGLINYIRLEVYKSAAGMEDEETADLQFIERLKNLIQYMPKRGKYGIMAFDYFYHENGKVDKFLSTFHVPNDYVMKLVKNNPDIFFPIISIHPYRSHATEKLEKYAQAGVRFVKWLPNSMGIHPSSETMRAQLDAYYQIMKQYDMVLISHTGEEKATEAEEFQFLGNPLFLKRPLDMGVKVVMAHLASLGECQPGDGPDCPPNTPYLDVAINLMEDPKYERNLFADISALTQDNRKEHLDKVIESESIHPRLINGSDYPLPAINIVIQTRTLVQSGHITAIEREQLNEIYECNPLLFDFVLKRTLRHSKTGKKFPVSVFLENPYLPTN